MDVGRPSDVLRAVPRLVVLLLALALALLTAGNARAEGIQPEDFDVQIDMQPNSNDEEPDCTPASNGYVNCTLEIVLNDTGKEAKGTVKQVSTGRSGSIGVVCDFNIRIRVKMKVSTANPQSPEVTELSGGGDQSCSWHMDFGGGTTMTGSIAGHMTASLLNPQTGQLTANFTVEVVNGEGDFKDMVGTGTFTEVEPIDFSGGGGGGPPSGGGHRASAASVGTAAADNKMSLELKKGKSQVRIVAPDNKLNKKSKAGLRAVAAPKSSCRASATGNGKRVDLGKAKADGKGNADFGKGLAAKLGPGAWKLTVACASGNRSASDHSKVRIG